MSIFGKINNLLTSTQTYTRPPVPTFQIPDRGISVNPEEIKNVFAPTYYGEVSNRDIAKKELEGRVILNTALNRMKAHAERGTPKTLTEILSEPNQYQSYGGQQFKNYTASTSELDIRKKQEVDAVVNKLLSEIQSGQFKDNTRGAYYYNHVGDKIYYDNTTPLFKSNLGK